MREICQVSKYDDHGICSHKVSVFLCKKSATEIFGFKTNCSFQWKKPWNFICIFGIVFDP